MISRDDGEAVRWFLKSAESGNSSAKKMLAIRYITAKGVDRDPDQYKKWWLLAMEDGSAEEQFYTGTSYENGNPPFPQDLDEATRWYRKAAEQGHKDAASRYFILLNNRPVLGLEDYKTVYSRGHVRMATDHGSETTVHGHNGTAPVGVAKASPAPKAAYSPAEEAVFKRACTAFNKAKSFAKVIALGLFIGAAWLVIAVLARSCNFIRP